MQIQLNFANLPHTDPIEDRVRSELTAGLARFAERITRVEVHLHDESSTHKRTADDQKCIMEARLAGRHPLVVEHRAGDMYLAITEAAAKLKRAVTRQVERAEHV